MYLANCKVVYGYRRRLEPPTKAASHSPVRKAVNAASKAYIELLHAVSSRNDGPVNPKQYEIRFANIARLQLFHGKIHFSLTKIVSIYFLLETYPVRPKPDGVNVS